ncbi:MAG: ROK family protein [Cellulomonadaceae bacterium]|jgi:glucokinase|nr:ROK family protein [Cellulomonadaceae bacterium]
MLGPVVPASHLAGILSDGIPRSITELTGLSGLARSTVRERVGELVSIDLLCPTGQTVSRGGRPTALFQIRDDSWLVLAVDLGVRHCQVGVTNMFGTLLATHRMDIDIADGPDIILALVTQVAVNLLQRNGISPDCIRAVGVGLPGPVEHATGRPIDPPVMPGWHQADVPAALRSHFGVPVLVDNDVNAAVLGERLLGWPDCSDLVYVKVSTGIGAGIVSHGQLLRGAQGAAGDIGHVLLHSTARQQCRCGRVGCLEAAAGGDAIVRTLAQEYGRDVTSLTDVVRLAQAGDAQVSQLLRESGRAVGDVLVASVSLLNPSTIVLGGTLGELGDHLLTAVRETVYARGSSLATRDLTITRSKAGADAALVGAGVLGIEHLLSREYIQERIDLATGTLSMNRP